MDKPIKVYVPVEAAFDENGQTYPRRIHWEDGRTYAIDRILDVCPAPAARRRTGRPIHHPDEQS